MKFPVSGMQTCKDKVYSAWCIYCLQTHVCKLCTWFPEPVHVDGSMSSQNIVMCQRHQMWECGSRLHGLGIPLPIASASDLLFWLSLCTHGYHFEERGGQRKQQPLRSFQQLLQSRLL